MVLELDSSENADLAIAQSRVYTNEWNSHKAFPTAFGTTHVDSAKTITLTISSVVDNDCKTANEQTFTRCTYTDMNDKLLPRRRGGPPVEPDSDDSSRPSARPGRDP